MCIHTEGWSHIRYPQQSRRQYRGDWRHSRGKIWQTYKVDLKIELTFSIEAYASSHLDQYRPKIISATNGDVESILRAVARGSTRLWSLFLALCRVFNGSIFSLIQGVCTSVFDR